MSSVAPDPMPAPDAVAAPADDSNAPAAAADVASTGDATAAVTAAADPPPVDAASEAGTDGSSTLGGTTTADAKPSSPYAHKAEKEPPAADSPAAGGTAAAGNDAPLSVEDGSPVLVVAKPEVESPSETPKNPHYKSHRVRSRRLSFADEVGCQLAEVSYHQNLHYAPADRPSYIPPKKANAGCCVIS